MRANLARLSVVLWVALGFIGAEAIHLAYGWAVFRPLCAGYVQAHGVAHADALQFDELVGRRGSSTHFCRMTDRSSGFPVSLALNPSPLPFLVIELLRIAEIVLMGVSVVLGFVLATRRSN